MSRPRRADRWFLLSLVVLIALGAVLLTQPFSTNASERDATVFRSRHYWQSAFDAVSAACGVGLLTKSFDAEHTNTGRWLLCLIGECGALLFLAAGVAALRRSAVPPLMTRSPGVSRVLLVFIIWQTLAVAVGLVTAWTVNPRPEGVSEAMLGALAATASLGFAPNATLTEHTKLLAVLAWVTALGWPLWLALSPRVGEPHLQRGRAALLGGGYTFALLLLAGAICVFETPRGGRPPADPSALLSAQPAVERYGQSLQQVACAAGAGLQIEPLAERDVSPGTKVALGLTLLLGGGGFSVTGGVGLLLLLWVAAGLCSEPDEQRRLGVSDLVHAGLTLLCGLLLLVLVGALGMLLIEGIAGSAFSHPPSFADAFLDACSAVAGGGLTTGLTATITSRNLSEGIRLNMNLYPIGMAWLMLLMLAGRWLPVVVLARLSSSATTTDNMGDRPPAGP